MTFSWVYMFGWIYWLGSHCGTWSYAGHASASQGDKGRLHVPFSSSFSVSTSQYPGFYGTGWRLRALPSGLCPCLGALGSDLIERVKVVLVSTAVLAVYMLTSLAPVHVL